MSISFLSVLFFGFLLGIKHSVEPDHVIAVSTIASRSKKLWSATLSGIYWGIGHTITLFLVGMILIFLKDGIPDIWVMSLEFLVGIMLVYLGLTSIFLNHNGTQRNKAGIETNNKNSYIKSMVIGFVHGLAGSAAMILLTISTVSNGWEGSFYILIFGMGTIVGMLSFTTIIGIPFVYSKNKLRLNLFFTRTAGAISFLFGIFYMYNLGVTEGLFSLWLQ